MARILLVDDSLLSRRILEKVLKNQGHETIEAIDGKDGLEVYHRERPDCVITDLLMPVMSGQQFIQELRAGGSNVPVVVVSADIQTTCRKECEQFGISAFLNKPFEEEALVDCVNSVLQNLVGVEEYDTQR